MSIRTLRYLIAVAECLNFHEAARRCHATQSTLSIQLRKLEEYLDVRCFERDRSGVRLTAAGRECVTLARKIIVAFDDMRRLAAASPPPDGIY